MSGSFKLLWPSPRRGKPKDLPFLDVPAGAKFAMSHDYISGVVLNHYMLSWKPP